MELHQTNYMVQTFLNKPKLLNDLMVNNSINSQPLPLPLAHFQYIRQDCQVNIRCSPCSSIDIDCIHLLRKSSFISSLVYDSKSFVETEDKRKSL